MKFTIEIDESIGGEGYMPVAFRVPVEGDYFISGDSDGKGKVLGPKGDCSCFGPRLIVEPMDVEPDDSHRGDIVEVRQRGQEEWVKRKLEAVLPVQYYERFICQNSMNEKATVKWRFARIIREC